MNPFSDGSFHCRSGVTPQFVAFSGFVACLKTTVAPTFFLIDLADENDGTTASAAITKNATKGTKRTSGHLEITTTSSDDTPRRARKLPDINTIGGLSAWARTAACSTVSGRLQGCFFVVIPDGPLYDVIAHV